jgi:sugar phosphate isomerase/epimerase
LPARVWGDGDPEGVRQRAAEEMRLTARAAVNVGVTVVTGFTGSSIWHLAYSFPPVPPAWIDEGAVRCGAMSPTIAHTAPPTPARLTCLSQGTTTLRSAGGPSWTPSTSLAWTLRWRFTPQVPAACQRRNTHARTNVARLAEIAFDVASTERALAAIERHPRFCFNFDPSHFVYQNVDYVLFIRSHPHT